MRKRVQIALAFLLVAIAGVIVWLTFREPEPVYQGKRLTVWLDQYGTNHWSSQREGERQAEEAIRHIGTKEIPRYLKMIRTREWPLKAKLVALIPKPWLAHFPIRTAYDYRPI